MSGFEIERRLMNILDEGILGVTKDEDGIFIYYLAKNKYIQMEYDLGYNLKYIKGETTGDGVVNILKELEVIRILETANKIKEGCN